MAHRHRLCHRLHPRLFHRHRLLSRLVPVREGPHSPTRRLLQNPHHRGRRPVPVR